MMPPPPHPFPPAAPLREIPSQRTHCVDIARYTLDNCNKERRNRPYVFKLKPDAAAGGSSTQK